MSAPIEDYALIGDCETAALVSRAGSIDWLCLPRFDSAACFAALLGSPKDGRWLIEPSEEVRMTRRRYREGTLILETDFETASGAVTLIDYMPIRDGIANLVRQVVGRRGTVPMRLELIIRFDYGSIVPWVRRIDRGLRATAGPDSLYLFTDVNLRGEDMRTVADFAVSAGETVPFQLVWQPTHQPQPAAIQTPGDSLRQTESLWREWSARCSHQGEWREAVTRSLITLKALTYQPTGGIVAAATTSLPEQLGGVRNWDYRYCWVRDATFTLHALVTSGYMEEASAWREWLINAVAGVPSEMQIMYGVAGERRLTELELPWLSGYQGSSPVRTGNAAFSQHQLDIYGEVMDALYLARRDGLEPSENAWRVQRALMDYLEGDWDKPDEGIWEVRGPKRNFVHSKVMAWVAMDRAVKEAEIFALPGPVDEWRELRKRIHEEICHKGFDSELRSFVQYYGAREPDASLLMLPLVGFLPASDPRMRGTVELIQKRLLHEGFVHRYVTDPDVDGLPTGEGAFLVCTFWLADNLALQGRHSEAREIFEGLLGLRNDVGLLSEQYGVSEKRLLGNFPQAISHVGLINTAFNLTSPGRVARG